MIEECREYYSLCQLELETMDTPGLLSDRLNNFLHGTPVVCYVLNKTNRILFPGQSRWEPKEGHHEKSQPVCGKMLTRSSGST